MATVNQRLYLTRTLRKFPQLCVGDEGFVSQTFTDGAYTVLMHDRGGLPLTVKADGSGDARPEDFTLMED